MAQNEPQRKETPPGPSPNSPSLLFEYQCTSSKFIRLANRIESKLFLPELECSSGDGAVRQTWAGPSIRCSATSSDVNRCPLRVVCRSNIFFWCCRGSLARRSTRCRRQIYSVVRRGGFGGGGGGRPVVGRIEMCESFISETVF